MDMVYLNGFDSFSMHNTMLCKRAESNVLTRLSWRF